MYDAIGFTRRRSGARRLLAQLVAHLFAAQAAIVGFHGVEMLHAQDDSTGTVRVAARWSTGSVSFQLGATHLGLGDLNESLARNGRPEFRTSIPTIGVSGHMRFGRVILGASSETMLPDRRSSQGWVNKLSFGSATIDAGFAVVDAPRVLVYPQVSLGIRRTSLHLERSGDFAYEDGVSDPARGVSMSSFAGLMQFGLVAEAHLSTRHIGEFSIGLRAGIGSVSGSPLTLAGESRVYGAPREGSGRYLRLSVGKPVRRKREALNSLLSGAWSLLGS